MSFYFPNTSTTLSPLSSPSISSEKSPCSDTSTNEHVMRVASPILSSPFEEAISTFLKDKTALAEYLQAHIDSNEVERFVTTLIRVIENNIFDFMTYEEFVQELFGTQHSLGIARAIYDKASDILEVYKAVFDAHEKEKKQLNNQIKPTYLPSAASTPFPSPLWEIFQHTLSLPEAEMKASLKVFFRNYDREPEVKDLMTRLDEIDENLSYLDQETEPFVKTKIETDAKNRLEDFLLSKAIKTTGEVALRILSNLTTILGARTSVLEKGKRPAGADDSLNSSPAKQFFFKRTIIRVTQRVVIDYENEPYFHSQRSIIHPLLLSLGRDLDLAQRPVHFSEGLFNTPEVSSLGMAYVLHVIEEAKLLPTINDSKKSILLAVAQMVGSRIRILIQEEAQRAFYQEVFCYLQIKAPKHSLFQLPWWNVLKQEVASFSGLKLFAPGHPLGQEFLDILSKKGSFDAFFQKNFDSDAIQELINRLHAINRLIMNKMEMGHITLEQAELHAAKLLELSLFGKGDNHLQEGLAIVQRRNELVSIFPAHQAI